MCINFMLDLSVDHMYTTRYDNNTYVACKVESYEIAEMQLFQAVSSGNFL